MFRVNRRNIFIFSLVMVLCCISYLNYAINKYSLLETSSDFEKYEENKLAEIPKEKDTEVWIEDTNNEKESTEESIIIDSNDHEMNDVIAQTSGTIETSITNSTNIKRSNYFMEARLNMDMEREKMVILLNEIISNERTDESNRKAANDEKMKLIDVMSKEKVIENLIKAKGFEDALVFITDHSVNVIIDAEELTDSNMAKILDIVMRETNVPYDNIKILNKF
ncbi:SpoIIIAH-like family protein [Clostridiaceae bacterium 35-E11]